MSLTAICTITTSSHLFKVKALYDSLEGKTGADFHCLVTDGKAEAWKNGHLHGLEMLKGDTAEAIFRKYTGNKLRWACKSLFMLHLLETYERVIYVDNDIAFYSSPDFLFEQLQEKSILLTPHFYPADPTHDQNWLEANYRVGLYNAGFIGASRRGADALRWWGQCCAYTIRKDYYRGLFDDQKYLDLFPVLFDGVEILKHKGCNVAGWNILTSPRNTDASGQVWLDGKWPLVFVHYNYYTIDCIQKGKDPGLQPHWQQYLEQLQHYAPGYSAEEERISLRTRWAQYLDYARYRLGRLWE